jgi:hypothetical protein
LSGAFVRRRSAVHYLPCAGAGLLRGAGKGHVRQLERAAAAVRNHVTQFFTSLCTDIDDPIERLAAASQAGSPAPGWTSCTRSRCSPGRRAQPHRLELRRLPVHRHRQRPGAGRARGAGRDGAGTAGRNRGFGIVCCCDWASAWTRARSSTDRASDYGSEGCRFESCRAHSSDQQFIALGVFAGLARLLFDSQAAAIGCQGVLVAPVR